MSPCIPFIAKLFKLYEIYSKNNNLHLMLLLTAHMLLLNLEKLHHQLKHSLIYAFAASTTSGEHQSITSCVLKVA